LAGGWQLERPEELDLPPKLDAEPLARPPARLGHERERVRRGGASGVLDEVRVARRELRAADEVASQAAWLGGPPGRQGGPPRGPRRRCRRSACSSAAPPSAGPASRRPWP